MRKSLVILAGIFGMFLSYNAQACDWDMERWHGDTPGMWHGHEYYGCPYHGGLQKKYQDMVGGNLFESKGCTACHTIGGGDKTGPDLQGLFKRRNEKWVREFIQDPTGKVQTDSKAKNLKKQYGTQMPQMALSPKELDQIVEFLKTATQ